MTEDVKQPERDPILDKEVTLKFTIEQINGILNLIGSEIAFIKVVGLVTEIERQVRSQIVEEQKENESTSAS